ncbi:hypothetical protein WOB87_12520 [Vibrio parahaemolyticus]|uniref:hypothetical protein n=1 Tax=Vibrio parahaemolyticus TaxID=670 RepID=UPI00301D0211|nr:hypothetical protein [Vibrio parahaemolyticus]
MLQEIITTILTSSLITGLFVFLFKESYKAKLNQLSKDLDSIKSYQAKDYDSVTSSIKSIWGHLADIDDYMRNGIAKDIEKGSISNQPLQPFLLAINKEMVFLPEQIYKTTDSSLEKLSNIYCKTINDIGSFVNGARDDLEKQKQAPKQVNSILSESRYEFDLVLKDLRKEFREYIEKHT